MIEVLDNPATEEGVLLKVMARGPFEQGQQVWIVDRDGSKVGATVENCSTNHRQRSDALDCVAGVSGRGRGGGGGGKGEGTGGPGMSDGFADLESFVSFRRVRG